METVALVGRPNVGKSTLFNRLIGSRKAVVSTSRGTTRDRLYGQTQWRGVSLTLVDTGGLELEITDPLTEAVQRHVRVALDEAQRIVLVCDAKDGLLPADQMIMDRLRPLGKSVLVAVNKADHRPTPAPEFFALGTNDVCAVSALHGRGIGELLDRLVASPTADTSLEDPMAPVASIAIVGRQNVGKSSLFNALVREERVIVSDRPGTTRDAVDTHLIVHGTPLVLVDTAGLRHRRKVRDPVDMFSMSRAIDAIQRSDVTMVVLDGTQGVTRDDQRLITQVCEAGCGIVLLVNKWDLVKGVRENQIAEAVHRQIYSASFAPVVPISAKTGFQVAKALQSALQISQAIRRGLSREELLKVLQRAWANGPIPRFRGRLLRLRDAQWVPGRPIRIALTLSPPGSRPLVPYERYLLKQLHAHPALAGIPLQIVVVKGKS